MPTYEYQCTACEHVFEQFQKINDDPLVKCPACNKKKLRRMFGGGAAVVFKGSGFYETDYRSEGYKSAAKADSQSATDGEKSGGDGAASKASDEKANGKAGSGSDQKSKSGAAKSESKSATPKKSGGKPKKGKNG